MFEEIKKEIDQLAASSKLKEFHTRVSRAPNVIEIRGKQVVDFTSWDFLGLGQNKKVVRALQVEAENFGVSANSSRLNSGTTLAHVNLEKRIASFFGTQSALLFSQKNQAVLSLIHALTNESDIVFYDENMQSPIADACVLSRTTGIPFNSSNLDSFELEIAKHKANRGRFVLIESVSPISGKSNDLIRLSNLCKKNQINLIVDESFALTHSGLRGAGRIEELSLSDSVFLIYSSLSHCLPGVGACLAGNAIVTGLMLQKSRTFSSEISMSSCIVAATEASIDVAELSQTERAALSALIKEFRDGLSQAGFLDAGESISPIVSVMVGNGESALKWSEVLFQKGFLVDPVSVKTLVSDVGFIRVLVNVCHTQEQIKSLLLSITDIANRLGEDG